MFSLGSVPICPSAALGRVRSNTSSTKSQFFTSSSAKLSKDRNKWDGTALQFCPHSSTTRDLKPERKLAGKCSLCQLSFNSRKSEIFRRSMP
uniref:Uncharacterized protein LOC8285801 n=1 Tax=Rhizophora mucronata TaxID=61149 RepID=A0A2P2MMH7_RHIMU